MNMPPMHCPTCGRHGNEEDGCEVGEPCPDEECDGTVESTDRTVYIITIRVGPHPNAEDFADELESDIEHLIDNSETVGLRALWARTTEEG